MIRNQWYIVLETKELKSSPIGVKRLNQNLVFYRDKDGKAVCLVDKCSHRGAKLSQGKIIHSSIQCPFHGLEFDPEGKCIIIPANGKLAAVPENFNISSYPTYENHGFIWIFNGQRSAVINEPEFFDNIEDCKLFYRTVQDPWTVHYSRVIENQLDVAHVPFVHKKTIGRRFNKIIDGPLLEWENENKFYIYTFNKKDNTEKPLSPSELKGRKKSEQRLEFIFPNLWQNKITSKMRVMVAFVPVDEENTIMYLRFYQGFVKTPIIRDLLLRIFMPYNLKIAHEDRTIVNNQLPKRTEFKMDENLFIADLPIIAYRKRCDELMKMGKV